MADFVHQDQAGQQRVRISNQDLSRSFPADVQSLAESSRQALNFGTRGTHNPIKMLAMLLMVFNPSWSRHQSSPRLGYLSTGSSCHTSLDRQHCLRNSFLGMSSSNLVDLEDSRRLTRRTIAARFASALALLGACPRFTIQAAKAKDSQKLQRLPLFEPADVQQPRAIAVVAGGFLTAPEQYTSYARALEELGCAAVLYKDQSTLKRPQDLRDGAKCLLDAAESRASELGLDPSLPLVLVGHSRGCKTCITAATQSSRRVGCFVLLDPVDQTSADNSTALPDLQKLKVPAAILGSAASWNNCAPTDSNYLRFVEVLASSSAPRLVGFLARAGHLQFLDQRQSFFPAFCTAGEDEDEAIRKVSLATTKAWVGAALTSQAQQASDARKGAVASLQGTAFPAMVEWQSADL